MKQIKYICECEKEFEMNELGYTYRESDSKRLTNLLERENKDLETKVMDALKIIKGAI